MCDAEKKEKCVYSEGEQCTVNVVLCLKALCQSGICVYSLIIREAVFSAFGHMTTFYRMCVCLCV